MGNEPPVCTIPGCGFVSTRRLRCRLASYNTMYSIFNGIIGVSSISSVTRATTFGGNLFRIRSLSYCSTIGVLNVGPNRAILSVYTTPNKGSFATCSLTNKGYRVCTCSYCRDEIGLVTSNTRELYLSGVRATIGSTSIFGGSVPVTSGVVYSIPYDKLNAVHHGPRVECGSLSSVGSLPRLRLRVLCASTNCLGGNNELLCSAYALGLERGRGIITTFLGRRNSFGRVSSGAFFPGRGKKSKFFYTILREGWVGASVGSLPLSSVFGVIGSVNRPSFETGRVFA